MVTLAYDKDSKQILGFIIADYKIDPNEVFSRLNNYEVVETQLIPPFNSYKNYMVQIDNGEVKKYILR